MARSWLGEASGDMSASQSVSFGDLLRRYRLAMGLTQEDLATRSGVSVDAISTLERGARRRPRQDTVALLAAALGLAEVDRTLLASSVRRSQTPVVPWSSPARVSALGAMRTPTAALPLVGRQVELEMLKRHHASAEAPLLLLTGEPGIGKTRLLQEAARIARAEGWTVLEGGCGRRGKQEPYSPLLQALEDFLAWLAEPERRNMLDGCTWLVRLLPELAETRIVPVPRWELSAEQERRLMFQAVAHLLDNATGPAGTLLVLDDLQWAGPDALDLLASLVARQSRTPLHVLGAYRDTEVRTEDPLAVLLGDMMRTQRAARAALGPLSPGEAQELLAIVLGALPASSVAAELYRRTSGIPYYLISCARGLGSSTLASAGRGARMPWELAQSIRERVSALADPAQDLLQFVTVLGRQVTGPILLAGARELGHDEHVVLRGLEDACRAQLLVEEHPDTYRFAHDLIAEVVEGDLSGARRKALHRYAGRAIERAQSQPSPAALAYHFLRGDEPERAIPYLEKAGDEARARHASADAADCYRDLVAQLDELGRPLEAAGAREKLADVFFTQAHYEAAAAVLEGAAETYRTCGDLAGLGRAVARLAALSAERGSPEEGMRRLRPLIELMEREKVSVGLAPLYDAQMMLFFSSARYREQLAAAQQLAELARATQDNRLLARAEVGRGCALHQMGLLQDATSALEGAIPLAEAAGELGSLCEALHFAGLACRAQGEFSRERVCIERGLIAARQLGDPTWEAFMIARRARSAFFMGDWDSAATDFEHSVELAREVGVHSGYAVVLLGLGRFALARGEKERASGYLDEALAESVRSGNQQAQREIQAVLAERDLLDARPAGVIQSLEPLLAGSDRCENTVTFLLPLLAWAYLETGDGAHAQAVVEQAAASMRNVSDRVGLIEALRVRALVATHDRRWQEAEVALAEALELCRTMGHPYAEAKTLYGMGLLYARMNEPARARERLEGAAEILGRFGERLYAMHAEHALAELSER